MTGSRSWVRLVGLATLVGVLLLVGLAAVGGTAAAQAAPDCSEVSYAQSGGAYQVSNVSQLQCMGNDSTATTLSDDFELTGPVDATDTASWNGGAGFRPIGNTSAGFAGTFDGNGYAIAGLTVDRGSAEQVGLFGNVTADGAVRNVVLRDAAVTGRTGVGGLVGFNAGEVSNASVRGSVDATGFDAGGLVGINEGTISDASADATVTGIDGVGGLVGFHESGTVSASSASGEVSGNAYVGGFVGFNEAPVSDAYATGDVSGSTNVGGFAGENADTVADTYATGRVSGSDSVGGLVGSNDPDDGRGPGTVERSYAVCSVSGTSGVGGLVGTNGSGSVTDAYWDVRTTGQNASDGGTGLQGGEMTGSGASTTMDGFDFGSTWTTTGGYPTLSATPQSPSPSPSRCGNVERSDGSADGPTITNYRVTAEGDRITVAFDSDDNLVEITAEMSGPETATLDREDFSGNEFEGFRATYTVDSDGVYTVEIVSARDAANEDGTEGEEFIDSTTVRTDDGTAANETGTHETSGNETTDNETTADGTADNETDTDSTTPTATPTDASTATPTDAPTDTPTADSDVDATPDEAGSTETPTDGDGTGFGVWVALAALVAAVSLRRRRTGET